jgi:hypothetical protein
MNNIEYRVVVAYAVSAKLDKLLPASKLAVEEVVKTLKRDPEPKNEYKSQWIENSLTDYKIKVTVKGGEISVLYRLWLQDRVIELIDIRESTRSSSRWSETVERLRRYLVEQLGFHP